MSDTGFILQSLGMTWRVLTAVAPARIPYRAECVISPSHGALTLPQPS
jgi:hypothetical protein